MASSKERLVSRVKDFYRKITTEKGLEEDGENPEVPVRKIILAYSGAALAASLNPAPLSDFLLITPLHAAMVLHLGRRLGFPITAENAGDVLEKIVGTVGLSIASRLTVGTIFKIGLPFLGGILRAPTNFALTYGLGRVAEEYFRKRCVNKDLDAAEARKIFSEAVKEGEAEAARAQAAGKKKKPPQPKKKPAGAKNPTTKEKKKPVNGKAKKPVKK